MDSVAIVAELDDDGDDAAAAAVGVVEERTAKSRRRMMALVMFEMRKDIVETVVQENGKD